MSDMVWNPSESFKQSTRLYNWMLSLGYQDYEAFYQQSINDIEWFWDQAVKELRIKWFEPYTKTLDLSKGMMYPEWFVNGKMNVTYNCVDKWADNATTSKKQALVWEGDDGETKTFTFAELEKETNKVANGLEELGVKPKDVVTIYMPMIPETVIAMLAIAKIGAIFSPAFSGYKADAVAKRINAANAKWLITADGFYRRGKEVHLKEEADKAVSEAPSIEKVIVVDRLKNQKNWNRNKDIAWKNIRHNESDYNVRETFGNDPFMIIYTSGTTGKPKGALHTHHGFPIKAGFDAGICMDVQPEDTLFWHTDMGWMMGPFLVFGGLMNGSRIVLFEGTPDYPKPDRIWHLVEKHRVTHLGISPTLIRSLMGQGEQWIEPHDLSTLKMIGSTGEPWNPEPWIWLFEKICKRKVPIFNYSGGTEISGGIFGNVLVKPIAPVSFNTALPGMDVDVYDEYGNSVINEVGELVIKKPWVGMTHGFYQDNERYENTYWNRYRDTWVHGDWVVKDEDGFFTITGRSDDTLNVAGKRIGPAEIESVLVQHQDVLEAGVIGVPHEVKGETPIAFVVLNNHDLSKNLMEEEMKNIAVAKLGKAISPSEFFFVQDLPKTRNAKVMRRAIKSAYLNEDSGDLSALENPYCLEEIRQIASKSG
ncbi:acetyl-CoA synthetase [Salinibacillus kushneri]|uniref:acetate--CoA ligase n=1 Tax=Salinibacillus kushneri TaxID=237682 RepID=A0A1I0DZG2_9BACI|nr:AMP-binding protein [Salinibacillus kushneri]SET37700.1 acetyl-CoA synthetase [Salinibacillus kushneri]